MQIIKGIFQLSFNKFLFLIFDIMRDENRKIDEKKNAEGKSNIPKLKKIFPNLKRNSDFLNLILIIYSLKK